MLNIPQLTGLFDPQPYVAPKDATANNLATISALQDPSGTLERMQAEQVIKGMADLKTDGIDNLYKAHALKAIDDYQNYSKNLYKSNKGFNRLNLNAQQLLDESSKYKDLLMNVNSLKQMSADYAKTIQQAAADVKAGIITPEAYKAFETDYEERNKAAKSIGELPFAHSVYNNYLSKNVSMDWLKQLDAAMAIPMKNATARTTSVQDPKTGKWFNQVQYDPLTDAMPLVDLDPKIRRGLEILTGGTPEAMTAFLRNRYDANSMQLAPGQTSTHIYNNGWGSTKEKRVPFVLNDDGTKSWIFQGEPINYNRGPVKGYIVGVTKMKDGKFYGELSIPIIDDVKTEKTLLSSGVKKVVNKFGNEVYVTPLDASDYGEIKRKGLEFETGKEEGFDNLGQQRDRTTKEKPKQPESNAAPANIKWYKIKDKNGNWTNVTMAALQSAGIDVKSAIKAGDIKE